MEMTLNNKHKWIRCSMSAVLMICILIHFAVFSYFNFQGFPRYCNSDVYADMQCAKRMWEQKTLFPRDWAFGNQFYVIATPVLAAIIYGITGNINLSMALATEVMSVLIIVSFLWLLRAFTQDLSSQLVCCLILLASIVCPYGPYSINSLLFFTQASFYSCYLITMFVVFGDYIRTFSSPSARVPIWVLSMLLSFGTGMHSLRQTAIMVLPIFAYELFVGLRNVLLGKAFWQQQDIPRLLRVVSYGLANLLGIVVMKLLNVPMVPIFQSAKESASSQLAQRFAAVVTAICEITSLDYLPSGDFSRLLAVVILFLIGITVIAAIRWIARVMKPESELELCWVLFLIGIVGVLLSTIVLDVILRSIYMFMWFPLVALSGLMLIDKLPTAPRYGAMLLVCALSLCSLFYCYKPYMRIENSEATDAQQMCSWAMEQGYEYVYGEYWGTAPTIAVYSNGQIDAGCWHTPQNVFRVASSNTPRNIYGAAQNEKAIYVFTSADEVQGLQKAKARGVTLKKVAEFGQFCAYTSPVPLMEYS